MPSKTFVMLYKKLPDHFKAGPHAIGGTRHLFFRSNILFHWLMLHTSRIIIDNFLNLFICSGSLVPLTKISYYLCWTATNSYCKCTLTIKWKWVNFTTKYWVSILDLQTLLSHTVFYLSYFELQTGQGQSFDFVCWLLIWRSSRCLLWKAFSQWSHLWFRRSWWAFRTCRLRTWNIIIPFVFNLFLINKDCKKYRIPDLNIYVFDYPD